MSKTIAHILVFGALVVVALAVKTSLWTQVVFADDAQKTTPQSVASKSEVPQVYELRIYTAAEGKMEALHKRFREHTLRLFEKHGIKNIGYWTEADQQDNGRLYYIIAYPDRASRDKMLVNGIAADPEFRKAVADSEREGKLTTGTESVILLPTDYSPLK